MNKAKEKAIKYPKGKPIKVLIGSEFELQTLLLNAKKEVTEKIFDDLVKEHIVCNSEVCSAPCCISFRELKKKYLNTSNTESKKEEENGRKK